jgi:hypothetical protein
MRAEKAVLSNVATTAGVEALRVERGLRIIKAEEEGSNIYVLPNGVYGFTFAPGLQEVPVYAKRPFHSFEIQRLTNGDIHTIGFVTAALAEAINGKEPVQGLIYPDPWQDSTVLVSLPDKRLQPAKKAVTREDGNPFKTLVFPA